MITRNFIYDIKFCLLTLGVPIEDKKNINLKNVKTFSLDSFFRIKDFSSSSIIFSCYQKIMKKWKKIEKAMKSHKWDEVSIPFECPLEKAKKRYKNISFISNAFSPNFCSYYLNEKGLINGQKIEIPKRKNKIKEDGDVRIVKAKDGINYLYERKYLQSLKKNEEIKTSHALASIETFILNFHQEIIVSFITYHDAVIQKSGLYENSINASLGQISEAIKQIAMEKITQLITTSIILDNINTMNNLRMMQFASMRSFYKVRLNR